MSYKQKIIYFGHPIITYDTEIERQLLNAIHSIYPADIIENPNQPHHKSNYFTWRDKPGETGMDYFYKEVLPNCDEGVFLAFRDGKWGSGVFGEARAMDRAGKKIYEIYVGRDMLYIAPMIISVASNHALTIKETRARTHDSKGGFLPY